MGPVEEPRRRHLLAIACLYDGLRECTSHWRWLLGRFRTGAPETPALAGETPANIPLPTNRNHVVVVESSRICIRPDSSEAYARIRGGVLEELRGAHTCVPPDLPERSLESAPTFTPFTVAPTILNRPEVVRAMTREYPPLLHDAGIGGTVLVYFFIDENGVVQDTRIHESSGHQALDDAALAVAEVYRFSAALNRDRKVPVWVSFPITFQVR